MGATRRECLIFLIQACSLMILPARGDAKDGGDDSGGGSGSDDSGHDSSGHGSDDDSGSGSGSSKDGDDAPGSPASWSASEQGGSDFDHAMDQVRRGKVLPLKAILKSVDTQRFGRLIDVKLGRSASRTVYQLKMRDRKNVIRTVVVDATSGSIVRSF